VQNTIIEPFQAVRDLDVNALRDMGNPEEEWCLPELKGLTREAGIALLDRAAEVGLLTALGRGYYRIHPALPWFFRRLFDQCYPERRNAATRAFGAAMGRVGHYYWRQYQDGNRDVIGVLAAEEANLLQARGLARSNGWWHCLIGTMQGLGRFYDHTGRAAEWSRLVEEIVPDFIDPATDGPLPGKDADWSLVTQYRVHLAENARQWDRAERLQRQRVSWNRQRAAAILAKPQQAWTEDEKNAVRTLATSLHGLSEIQREQGSAECVHGYREALSHAEQIQDSQGAAACAANLGHAYEDLPGIRDLALAERWYQRSLDLHAKKDRIRRAGCLVQLGSVAYERFLDASKAGRPPEECHGYLSQAERYNRQALEMFPANAVRELGPTHHQLGIVYAAAGQIDTALRHYRESIRYYETMKDRFGAGQSRFNAALALAGAGRFADARDWAQAALRDYQACENADERVVETLKLLECIESGLRGT
jgi:tetratricopeptide (TPR) repeat protein